MMNIKGSNGYMMLIPTEIGANPLARAAFQGAVDRALKAVEALVELGISPEHAEQVLPKCIFKGELKWTSS